MTIEAGMSIDQAARHMVRQADALSEEVRAKFNDFELAALPGDTADHVAKPYWDEAARRERHHEAIRTLSARVVEAAVELRDMHERVRSALRAMYAYIQGPCDCGVCAAVDAYLAALEGR